MSQSKHRSCKGKKKHTSFSNAEYARIKTQEACGQKALGMCSYKCQHCGFWHVGHAPKAIRKQLATRQLLSSIDRAVAREKKP